MSACAAKYEARRAQNDAIFRALSESAEGSPQRGADPARFAPPRAEGGFARDA